MDSKSVSDIVRAIVCPDCSQNSLSHGLFGAQVERCDFPNVAGLEELDAERSVAA
jgi:hypothetical protein